jgi:hypothetical protein
MRYELRLTAFDMLDQVHVSAACYSTPESPEQPIERVWARTETVQGEGCTTATDWIREALLVMLEVL